MPTTDLLIVGGGPAGLAAAIAARQHGFAVTVVDRAQPPIDKACGEGIMPDGMAALQRLGIEVERAKGCPFYGIRFLEGALLAEARFGRGHGLGIRRTVLHQLLTERALAAGVVLCWGTPVQALSPDRIEVGRQHVRCRWVLGADGQHSRIRRWGGLGSVSNLRGRVGLRQHFRITPWTDVVEVYWTTCCQAYVTPVGPQELCIALIGNEPTLRLTNLPGLFPDLSRRLHGAQPTTRVRGAMSASFRVGSVARDRIALLGDASGAVDALTGEGLSLAFRHAIALCEALALDDLAHYRAAHHRISLMPRIMSRLMLAMGASASLRRRTLSTLAAQPALFERLLALHIGALPARDFGLSSIANLAWHLFTAESFTRQYPL